jgi:hypothetical protein
MSPAFLTTSSSSSHLMKQYYLHVSINIPLDPSNPTSQKITHKYNKLNFTEHEDILEFFSTFDNIVETLALPEGSQRFRLIPATMGHDAQKKWFDITAQISPKCNYLKRLSNK